MRIRTFAVVSAALLLLGACAANDSVTEEGTSADVVSATADPSSAPTPSPAAPEPEVHITMGGVGIPSVYVLPDWEGEACASSGEFYDIREGAQVKITGPAGEVVALSELGAARLDAASGECVWMFSAEVPAGLGFYTATVLDRWSSEMLSEEDLLKNGFVVYAEPSEPLIDLKQGL